ncbi:hypothetical protein F443_15139 [Phytophthora nicotianae P1569]|uniref:Uncharacterized protein n=2 Tax=Phytophthora nicotianae TaxID=4792 RepID=V9EJ93_PHYNI|nr:hypothetical protein F443_15139 [Phytophthora nicotianae P1569]
MRDGFIVYASSTAIIRVVHVVIGDDIVDSYRLAFLKIKEACMGWIYTPDAPVPPFTADELGHCGDISTLKQHLSLWRIVVAKTEERGGPLPAAKHIIPSVIAIWNRVKGGIDVYSRYLKNIKPSHEHLPPLAALWLRFLMTLVYNAFQSAQLLSGTAFLMDEDRCKSYSIYQQHKNENASFRDFCRDAASCLGGNATDDGSIDEPRRPLSEVDTNVLSANELGSILLKPHSFAYRLTGVKAKMTPGVVFNAEYGTQAIFNNWRSLSEKFDDAEIELESLEMTNKLLGQSISMCGTTRFVWDPVCRRVSSVLAQSDMLTLMIRLLGSLENVSRVFEGALISPDFRLNPNH